MSLGRIFLYSFALATVVWSAFYYVNRPKRTVPELKRVADGVFISEQLKPENMSWLDLQAIRTVVDIRPDGEAPDQPSSSQIEQASARYGIRFAYIPVPHETIPDSAIEALSGLLASDAKPALLYCRSGRRAVRTYALARAAQTNGPSADELLKMVRTAGFSAEDLQQKIAELISHRSQPNAK